VSGDTWDTRASNPSNPYCSLCNAGNYDHCGDGVDNCGSAETMDHTTAEYCPEDLGIDNDNDGYYGNGLNPLWDCEDGIPSIHPNAREICIGTRDEDCDGLADCLDVADCPDGSPHCKTCVHYGELDTPSPTNASASYNETVPQSLQELRNIYKIFGGDGAVQLIVSPGKHHEMDIPKLLKFLDDAP
jgi:hypothetical protein